MPALFRSDCNCGAWDPDCDDERQRVNNCPADLPGGAPRVCHRESLQCEVITVLADPSGAATTVQGNAAARLPQLQDNVVAQM